MARPAPETNERRDFIREVIRRAGASRDTRRNQAAALRQWYERGQADGPPARYNKLRAHLDRLGSYLWSPESARFGLHLPPALRDQWLPAASVARDEFRQVWSDAGSDRVVSLALEWALVYGATGLKVTAIPEVGFEVGYIDPWDLGVTREDTPELGDQDVIVHWYSLSLPQFARWATGQPNAAGLLEDAKRVAREWTGGLGLGPSEPVVTGVTGSFPTQTLSGAFLTEPSEASDRLAARVIEPVVQLADCWLRRMYQDPIHGPYEDWEVETVLVDADVASVARRRNPILPWIRTATGIVLPPDHPFAVLAPRPLPDYTWGRSELAALIPLQSWREEHVGDLRAVIKRQLTPSTFFSGVPDFEEAGRAMSEMGGKYGTPDPTAKMETLRPEVGAEAFNLLGQIDAMFSDQSGIPELLAGGANPPGVRAANQLVALAGVGAGRIRDMALEVESALGRIATMAFRLLQRTDGQSYPDGRGGTFLLVQLPSATTLRVIAHSSAPIFAEQTQAKALALHRAGAIDGEWLVELLDPPYREELKVRARELAKSRAEQAERMIQLHLERLRRRGGPRP